jgi:hypothetical protein
MNRRAQPDCHRGHQFHRGGEQRFPGVLRAAFPLKQLVHPRRLQRPLQRQSGHHRHRALFDTTFHDCIHNHGTPPGLIRGIHLHQVPGSCSQATRNTFKAVALSTGRKKGRGSNLRADVNVPLGKIPRKDADKPGLGCANNGIGNFPFALARTVLLGLTGLGKHPSCLEFGLLAFP